MNRNVPEVNVVFEQVKYPPTTRIRQFNIQGDRNRIVFVCEIKHFTEIRCHDRLQLLVVCSVQHDLGKVDIILHDKHNFVRRENIISVIANLIYYFTEYIKIIAHLDRRHRL